MKYVSLVKNSVDNLRKDYIKEHSKFIHSSYLLLEDLDKEVELYGKKWRIAGLWDIIGYSKIILLEGVSGGHAIADSKEIAAALGFTKFRNFVTGKEITYDISAHYRYNQMLNKLKPVEELVDRSADIDEDVPGEYTQTPTDETDDMPLNERDKEYVAEDTEEEPEEVDPLVRALRPSEDDGGWVDESDES